MKKMALFLKSFNKFELLLTSFVFTLVIAGCIFSFTHPDFFRYKYTIEDGFLESMTVLFLFFGALTCFYRVYKLKNQRSLLFLACTLFLGLIFTFGAGEEISWGQRIFDFKSNEFFQEHNTQGEITLHNLSFKNSEGETVKINKLVFSKVLTVFLITYLLIIPLLYRKKEAIKKIIDKFAIPLPQSRHVLLYIFLAIIVLSLTHKKKGELLEFGGCFVFLMITLFPYNKHIFTLNKIMAKETK